MAHAAGDAHEYPVYGAHCRISFPILDADGDLVTGATSPDSEVSKDAGTFADCTNEATELATSSGMYYLDLTGAELTAKQVAVIIKSGNGKTTPLTLYPRRLPILESGTAQAGAASTITLASGASAKDDFYNGLFVLITNDSPSGAQYQLRRIVDYVGSTKVATVDSAWGTNPSSASTYDVLIPEGFSLAAIGGVKIADPTNAGYLDATVAKWLSGTPNALQSGRVDSYVGAFASAVIDAASIAADAIGAAELAADAATEIAAAVWDKVMTSHVTAGTFGQRLQALRTGTAQAGAAGTITLDASASATDDLYNSSVIFITAGTGAGQARRITDYVGSTKVATIVPNWATNPSSDSVFVIVPDGRTNLGAWLDTVPNALQSGRVDSYVGALASGVIAAASFAAGAIDAAAIADGAIDAGALASDTITAAKIAAGAITAAKFAAGAIDATAIATGAITAAKFAAGAVDAAALAADAATEIANAVLTGTTMAELAQAAPSATPSLAAAVMLMYMALRNELKVDSSHKKISNDAGTVIAKKPLADDGTTYTESEMVTGP